MKPTVGRVVLFRSSVPGYTGLEDHYAEVPGLVTFVHADEDGTMINCMVQADGFGRSPHCVTSVSHAQTEGEMHHHASSWRWMPYQKAVAAEREAAGLAPVS